MNNANIRSCVLTESLSLLAYKKQSVDVNRIYNLLIINSFTHSIHIYGTSSYFVPGTKLAMGNAKMNTTQLCLEVLTE